MANLSDVLQSAVTHHQAGRLAEAEAIYREILQTLPDQIDALHLLGVVLGRYGRYLEAVDRLSRAAALAPDSVAIHSNLTRVLLALDRFEAAEACARHTLALDPTQIDAQRMLGEAEHAQGRFNRHVLSKIAGLLADDTKTDDMKFTHILLEAVTYRARLLQRDIVDAFGSVVRGGPFQGMRYLRYSTEGCHIPKIIGTYESPLHSHIQAAVARGYDVVLNIGAADGYYAVGFALRLPAARIHAHDINREAHHYCRRLADLNGVADRIVIGHAFHGEDFARFAGQRVLVFCDIEGAELELLDPARHPALTGMDIIVELHDFNDQNTSRQVTDRFAATHDIVLVPNSDRDAVPPAFLDTQSHIAQLLALWEGRPGPTPWAVMRARAPAASVGT